MNERSCPICGKRLVPPSISHYVHIFGGVLEVTASQGNSTEPVCTGHEALAPRQPVPQAFYDAFKDEEK